MGPPSPSSEVLAAVRGAGRVAVLTGAGVSAESGIPTFRGAGGLWREHRPEDLATPEAFRRDPTLVWEWYDWRRGRIGDARPNPAHEALAAWEAHAGSFDLITQNIDGLHAAAGSRHPIELHGSIWRTRCTGCGEVSEDRSVPLPEIPPSCGNCSALLRPDVVWFGESLDPDILAAAVEAASRCELFLVAGTSSVVQPAASLATIALQSGAVVVEVNPERTPLTPLATHHLAGKAGVWLPGLLPGA